MAEPQTGTRPERTLVLLIRVVGGVSLLAVPFVFVPYSWMNGIHGWLGMGEMPSEPVVGYLARSTSAFYAMLGGLLLVLSCDVRRYRPVLVFLGAVVAVFGLALAVIDRAEGLPRFWCVWEGPFVVVFGVAMFLLGRRIGTDVGEPPSA